MRSNGLQSRQALHGPAACGKRRPQAVRMEIERRREDGRRRRVSCGLRAPACRRGGRDGSDPGPHGLFTQHQGAQGLLMRGLRPPGEDGGPSGPHPGAPGRHACLGPGGPGPLSLFVRPWGGPGAGGHRHPQRPLHGGDPPERRNPGGAGVRRSGTGREGQAAPGDGQADRICGEQGPPRGHWRDDAGLAAPVHGAVPGGVHHPAREAGAARRPEPRGHRALLPKLANTRGAPW